MKEKVLGTIATALIGAYSIFSLASHNGVLDSMRTKEANKYIHNTDITKVVHSVEEEWEDYFPWMLDGYNPKVTRTVTFEDGTETTLTYRTLAHQPYRKLISGEEFKPQKGEKYLVAKDNTLISKLK